MRNELGAQGAGETAYGSLKKLMEKVLALQNNVESMMMSKVDGKNMTKTIIDTLVEAINKSAQDVGVKMSEQISGLTEEQAGDMNAVRNKISEIYAVMQTLKEAQEAEGKKVIIKAWFEE